MMDLGTDESFEVWFLPRNRDAYKPRILRVEDTMDEATATKSELAQRMDGDIEIVRVRTERVRIA